MQIKNEILLGACPRPHCGGSLVWDLLCGEYRCLACARPIKVVFVDRATGTKTVGLWDFIDALEGSA
mgnify:FL=1